jgi:signal transduction histidine kinase/CheY-like chemotaxis protein
MMFTRHISLPVCLGAALSALVLLLAVILAGALGELARHEIASLASAHLESTGRQMARELSTGMDVFSKDLQDLASRDVLRNPAASAADVRAALDQFAADRPAFGFIGLADARSGNVLQAGGGLFEGSTLDRTTVENGSKGLFVGDVHGQARPAERMPRSPLDDQARFVDIAVPVRNERGQVVRVLAAHVNWQWTTSLRNSVLGPIMERRGIELLVINGDNKVVLAPASVPLGAMFDQLARRMPGPGTRTIPWSDGADYLTVMTATAPGGQFQGLGWKVVARQPARVAFASVATIQRSFFAGALALGLAGAAIAWFVTTRLLDPVRQRGNQAPGGRHSPVSGPPATRGKRVGDAGTAGTVGDLLQRLANDSQALTPTALTRDMEAITLADSLPHIVWQSDAHGLIEYCNAQWETTFGPVPIRHIDQLASLVHQADLPGFVDAWKTSRGDGSDLHCLLRLRSNRAFVWFRLHARAVRPDGRHPVRWVGTLTNVQDAIQQSERLELALHRERRARTEAERLALMADDFLATLSHELRTPLNAIAGWAEWLLHRAGKDDTVARAAEVINRNVQLQAGLLNDLLDTSAIISGKVVLEIRQFDAAALLADVALSQEPAAERKGVRFTCSAVGPLPLAGDTRRIHQAVTNLVSNAIKFTDAGGQVTLDATLEGESLLISVSDNGCGIAPQFLPHVFERFRQDGAAIAQQGGGFGLGLAIAARLVRLHGGAIAVHSAGTGQGSRFAITLPALAGATDSIVSAGTEQLLQQFPMTPLAGVRILVTDDEEDTRLATQSLLASFGATVTVSASGSETLRLLDHQGFDLLLCDIGMPGMDGHELIRAIRKRPRDKGAMTPAIALTAFAMTRDERASSLAGFDAHVAKPLSAQRLIETICSVCEVGNTY